MEKLFAKLTSYLQRSQLEWKNAAKMGIGATLSLYVILRLTEWGHRPDPLANGLWCVIATLVVLQANLGGTYKAIVNRLTGVFIGSSLGALAATILGTREISLGIAIFFTILLCSFFHLKESYRIASLAVTSVMIPWGSIQMISPWTFALFRSLDTVVGILLAIFIAYSFWPSTAVQKIKTNMAQILYQIQKIYNYTLLLKTNNQENHPEEKIIQDLVNETNTLVTQNQALIEEIRLEVLFRSQSLSSWIELEKCLERLLKVTHTIQSVYSQQLYEIFDRELKDQVEEVIQIVNLTFTALIARVENQTPVLILQDLFASDLRLNEQLLRFRETRTLRRYSFEEAERYFVFFYSLRLLITELKHFNDLLDLLFTEEERE